MKISSLIVSCVAIIACLILLGKATTRDITPEKWPNGVQQKRNPLSPYYRVLENSSENVIFTYHSDGDFQIKSIDYSPKQTTVVFIRKPGRE
jgi:hypothetical protein